MIAPEDQREEGKVWAGSGRRGRSMDPRRLFPPLRHSLFSLCLASADLISMKYPAGPQRPTHPAAVGGCPAMRDARLPSLLTLLLAASAASAQVRVEPATVRLSGPGASHSLLVTNKRDGRDLDRTRAARYSSSAPNVARV